MNIEEIIAAQLNRFLKIMDAVKNNTSGGGTSPHSPETCSAASQCQNCPICIFKARLNKIPKSQWYQLMKTAAQLGIQLEGIVKQLVESGYGAGSDSNSESNAGAGVRGESSGRPAKTERNQSNSADSSRYAVDTSASADGGPCSASDASAAGDSGDPQYDNNAADARTPEKATDSDKSEATTESKTTENNDTATVPSEKPGSSASANSATGDWRTDGPKTADEQPNRAKPIGVDFLTEVAKSNAPMLLSEILKAGLDFGKAVSKQVTETGFIDLDGANNNPKKDDDSARGKSETAASNSTAKKAAAKAGNVTKNHGDLNHDAPESNAPDQSQSHAPKSSAAEENTTAATSSRPPESEKTAETTKPDGAKSAAQPKAAAAKPPSGAVADHGHPLESSGQKVQKIEICYVDEIDSEDSK